MGMLLGMKILAEKPSEVPLIRGICAIRDWTVLCRSIIVVVLWFRNSLDRQTFSQRPKNLSPNALLAIRITAVPFLVLANKLHNELTGGTPLCFTYDSHEFAF